MLFGDWFPQYPCWLLSRESFASQAFTRGEQKSKNISLEWSHLYHGAILPNEVTQISDQVPQSRVFGSPLDSFKLVFLFLFC